MAYNPDHQLIGSFQKSWSKSTIDVFTDGFSTDLNGSKVFYLWEQIAGYFNRVTKTTTRLYGIVPLYSHTEYLLQFTMEDGHIFIFDRYKDKKQLSKLLLELTFGPLLAKTKKLLEAFGTVYFGSTALTKAGILLPDRRFIDWSLVKGVGMGNGYIEMEFFNQAKFGFFNRGHNSNGLGGFGSIPNALILVEMIRTMSPNIQ